MAVATTLEALYTAAEAAIDAGDLATLRNVRAKLAFRLASSPTDMAKNGERISYGGEALLSRIDDAISDLAAAAAIGSASSTAGPFAAITLVTRV